MTMLDGSQATAVLDVQPPRGFATATVGVVGAGQLARMMQRAAIDLGVSLSVLADSEVDPAVAAGCRYDIGSCTELPVLMRFASGVDVVTFDHERVPADLAEALRRTGVDVRPGSAALQCAQDKLHARQTMQAVGLPVPRFRSVSEDEALHEIVALGDEWGWPLMLKHRFGGYDGRGVQRVDGPAMAAQVVAAAPPPTGGWLVEAHVDIAVELAVLIARRPSGFRVTYPVIETVQVDGICRHLVMPARVPDSVAARAVALAECVADGIDAVGIIAVELFCTSGGEILINEIAVRPHNSGHATIEATATSQFENHLRAVLDWPLGDTTMRAPAAAMVNVLGPAVPSNPTEQIRRALAVPGAHLHYYGKRSVPGRKLGHVTALGATHDEALAVAAEAAARLAS